MPFPKGNQRKGESPVKQPRPGIPLAKSVSADTVMKLIEKTQGNLSHVADHIGTTRSAIRRMVDANPMLKEALADARERQIDDLEKVVFERAQDSNDTTLQLFLLKTQGKQRGYDQSEAQNTAKDIATAAFDFIINKSKTSQ